MSELTVDEVSVRFDRELAVDGVSLRVDADEIVAVLGPSGCGKSSLLRAIAGLEPLETGRVLFDGVDQASVPVHRRGFGLMFQDGQLFENLSVRRNVEYGPRRRGVSRTETAEIVEQLLSLVGLTGFGPRKPSTLSGGQRQRVALARALAARPRLLLLDEPLTALDASLRVRLAGDVRRVLKQTATMGLLVTHDHDEAFAIADRVVLMRDGRFIQVGTPREVWSKPVDEEAALFLGYARVLSGAELDPLRAAFGLGPERLALRLNALRLFERAPERGGVGDPAPRRDRAPAVLEQVPDAAPGSRREVAGDKGAERLSVRTGTLGAMVLAVAPALDELRLVVRLDDGQEIDAVAPIDAAVHPGDTIGLELVRSATARLGDR